MTHPVVMPGGDAPMGRLAIVAGPRPRSARFLVVPDDGGEAIELRVSRAAVLARHGEAVVASLRCYVHSIDITDIEGTQAITLNPREYPAIFPHLRVLDQAGRVRDRMVAALWRFIADGTPSFWAIKEHRTTASEDSP